MPKGAVTESKRVAVTKSVSADDINEFISYCNKFYGKAGIYKDQLKGGFSVTEIKRAVLKYLKDLDENPTWGDGDSLDRERVRQILQPSYSLLAKGGKLYADGGNTPASLDDLKKGDRIHITFDSSIKKDHDKNLIIKNKTVVGVGKSYESNKVSMTDVDNPNGVKYFAYKRKGDDKWRWAMGDMAISNVKMHKKDAMAKGGVTEHGLRKGDTITDDMFWSNEAIVRDSKGEKHKVNLEQGKRYAGGGMTHSVAKLKRFAKQYLKNEDENYHSENVVLLAKTFGSKNDVKEATEILKEHDRIGYLSDDLYEKRKELDKKLYPIAKRILDMNQIKMAKGGMIGGFSYSIGGL